MPGFSEEGYGLLTKKPENWEFISDKTIVRLLDTKPPVNRIILGCRLTARIKGKRGLCRARFRRGSPRLAASALF